MSRESRERVVAAINNTPRVYYLAWLHQHCLLADPRGPHWGVVNGHPRSVTEIESELRQINWRRVKKLDEFRTRFVAKINGVSRGIFELRDLPPTTKVWIERVDPQGHGVRLYFGGALTTVYLGSTFGYRILVSPHQSAARAKLAARENEVTIVLRRGEDERETVESVFPGERDITRSFLIKCSKHGNHFKEGEVSVKRALAEGFRFGLFAHQLINGKPREIKPLEHTADPFAVFV